jgi:AraC-like DNA-binding protein
LLIASIPGLIIGFSTYWLATHNLQEKLEKQHLNLIEQRATNIDEQLNYLEMTMSHWAFDTKFDDKLRSLDYAYGFEQVQELFRTLLMLEGTHPFLQNVELFLNNERPVRFQKDRYTYITAPQELEVYNSLLKHSNSAMWTNLYPYGSPGTLTLVNKIPGGSLSPFGIIVATINKAKLVEALKILTPYNEGETLLMDAEGNWEVSTSSQPQPEFAEALRQAYKERAEAPAGGSFLFQHGKSNYSVSYGQFNRLGFKWVYVSAAPLTSIIAPVVTISKWILYISSVCLMVALLLSWLVSKRIYSPVERLARLLTRNDSSVPANSDEFEMLEEEWKQLESERVALQSRLKEQLPALRDGFFLQLVQGYLFALDESELRQRMRHYGWTNGEEQYGALLVHLTGFSGLKGRFSLGDENLVTFAAANIMQELAGKHYAQAEVVNFHNFSIGLLIAQPADEPDKWLRDDVDQFCAELIQTINHIIRMKVTVAISKQVSHAKQIPHIFEEVKLAMAYRELHDENQVIWTEELAKAEPAGGYPFALDKEIVSSLRSGLEEEAGRLIGQFMDELSANSSTEFHIQQGMLQLLGSIRYAALQSSMNPVQLFGSTNIYEELAGIKERGEILGWFRHRIVRAMVKEMISRQDYHLKHIVEKVVLYLQEHYMMGLSLESCADQYGTSPYTLSRAFKQITGVNFIDYLTNIRIDNAKALLLEPDLKINEVAERVGYQHSYFNRIFKKYTGITPSQYRELNSLQSGE